MFGVIPADWWHERPPVRTAQQPRIRAADSRGSTRADGPRIHADPQHRRAADPREPTGRGFTRIHKTDEPRIHESRRAADSRGSTRPTGRGSTRADGPRIHADPTRADEPRIHESRRAADSRGSNKGGRAADSRRSTRADGRELARSYEPTGRGFAQIHVSLTHPRESAARQGQWSCGIHCWRAMNP
jgi:hypothetical protein